jgi:small GTP-binding protein
MSACEIGAVGKSALAIQIVHDYFITDYDPTIEDSYKRVLAVDNEIIQLDILDTAGQDDFAPMRPSYTRQAKASLCTRLTTVRRSRKSRSSTAI